MIGLITIHYANSYGGVLQAYSALRTLSKIKNAEVINYQPQHLANGLKPIRIGKRPSDALRTAKDILRYPYRRSLISKFEKFIKEEINTSEIVTRPDEITALGEKYSTLVAGSDQLWNPAITNGLDTNYLLGFSTTKRKIAFSSSFGSYKHTPEELEILRRELKHFHAISVREPEARSKLESLVPKKEVHVTLDPTLLLDMEEWSKVSTDPGRTGRPYILVYALGSNAFLKKTVETARNFLQMDVIAINQDPFLNFKTNKHVKDAGPSEFLGYFLNASFIITNSFHGTAFSINFKKNFVTTPPHSGANRIENLLGSLSLRERLISSPASLNELAAEPINYTEPHKILNSLKLETLQYIHSAIDSCEAQ